MNLTAPHLTILLDLAAFFLVTIDLYGEERLRKSGASLYSVVKTLRHNTESGLGFLFTLGGVTFSLMILVGMFLPPNIQPGWNVPTVTVVATVSFFGLICVVALLLLLAWCLTAMGLFMLSKANLHGLMLFAGAILFVISKTLTWFSSST